MRPTLMSAGLHVGVLVLKQNGHMESTAQVKREGSAIFIPQTAETPQKSIF